MQLVQLRELEPKLLELGYRIIAISPDRPDVLRHMAEKYKLNYLLLSDSAMHGAMAFGIAYEVVGRSPEYYRKLARSSGQKHGLLPVPAIFVVGRDGVIKFEHVNPNYKERLPPGILLAVARGLKEQQKEGA